MEIQFLKKEPHFVEFKLIGERHTFPNLLRQALLDNPDVEFVAYKLEHPLDNHSFFVLRTKSKSAKKVLLDAAKEIVDDLEDLKQAMTKALK